MKISTLTTTKAFIEIEEGEEYPDTIRVTVDKNRTFVKKTCKQCSTIFYVRKGNLGDFCSRECHRNATNFSFICASCGKEHRRPLNKKGYSKSKKYFCSRKCKDYGQSIEGGINEIQPPHFEDGSRTYASRAMRYQKRKNGYNFCEICKETNKLFLIVHHIDYNRSNNNIKNLQVICANCHIRLHRLNTGVFV